MQEERYERRMAAGDSPQQRYGERIGRARLLVPPVKYAHHTKKRRPCLVCAFSCRHPETRAKSHIKAQEAYDARDSKTTLSNYMRNRQVLMSDTRRISQV
jgi:hypothetical protein